MQIANCMELERQVVKMGFLPFFKNEIPQFSIEEIIASELWFSEDEEGPWEWKGPIARRGKCAYGKLFNGKAGFVGMDWYPELVNYRRASFQFTETERVIYKTLMEYESLLTKDLKVLCGFVKPRKKNVELSDLVMQNNKIPNQKEKKESFELAITRLQMSTFVVVADFEYAHKKNGEPYGWGIARYTTPEALYGEKVVTLSNSYTPEESKQRIIEHLSSVLPWATEEQLLRIIS